jgi:hypothetical protein
MKNWVAQNYPNTKIGLTEYNWGAENHINGATTQADIYGILGREGMDMATRWTTPDAAAPTFKAMKMFRNYDGQKSGFGETSVSAIAPNPDNVSAFASVRTADGALTIMIINKSAAAPVNLNIANFTGGNAAQVWQLTAANQINRLADAGLIGSASATRTVSLGWQDNSNDENGFVVERADGSSPTVFSVAGQTATNTTRWRTSAKRGIYIYRIRATRGGVVSAPSNTVQVIVR